MAFSCDRCYSQQYAAEIPADSLAVGAPARVVRELTPEEISRKRRGTAIYQRLALEAKARLAPVSPRTAPEPDGRRIRAPNAIRSSWKLGD